MGMTVFENRRDKSRSGKISEKSGSVTLTFVV